MGGMHKEEKGVLSSSGIPFNHVIVPLKIYGECSILGDEALPFRMPVHISEYQQIQHYSVHKQRKLCYEKESAMQ